MANSNSVREIKTRLSLDGETAFRKSLKSVDSSLNAMNSELRNVSSSFDESTSQMEKNQKKSEVLTKIQEQLRVKVTALKDAVKTSAAEYEQAKAKAEKLTAEYGEQSKEAKVAWAEVEMLGQKLDRMTTMSNNAETKLNGVTSELDKLGREADETADNADEAAKALDRTGDEAEEAARQSKDAANGGFTVLKGVMSDLVTDVLHKAVDAFHDLAIEVYNTGTSFESSMSKVGAISGASEDDMEKLTAAAKEYGEKTIFSASQSAEALQYMALAGWNADQSVSGLPGILNLAAASGEDLATTSDIVTDALTAFGLAAEDSTRFADILAATSANSNTNVAMMGESFKYIAPVAGTLGYTAEDTALAIGLMANSGIKATQSGTALRKGLLSLTAPAQAAQDEMRSLGFYTEELINTFDQSKIDTQMLKVEKSSLAVEKAQSKYNAAVEGFGEDSDKAEQALAALNIATTQLEMDQEKLSALQSGETKTVLGYNQAIQNEDGSMKSLGETISFLRDNMRGLDEAQQASAAAHIFGTNAVSGMLAIINASDEDFEKLKNAIDGSTGAAERMADVMSDNTEGDAKKLGSVIESLQLKLYDKMAPSLRKSLQEITKFLSSKKAEELIDKLGDGIGKFAEFTVEAIKFVAENFDDIIDTLKVIGEVGAAVFAVNKVSKFVGSIKTLTGTFSGLKGMISGVGSALSPVNVLMGAAALTGWAVYEATVGQQKAYEELVDKYAELTDREKIVRDSTQDLIDSYGDWIGKQDELVGSADKEFSYYSSLRDELDKIIDKNGHVKEGYEKRAEIITGELSQATGIEIGIIDGQIQKYDELCDAIDNVLQKKKAEAYLGAYGDKYKNALTGVEDAGRLVRANEKQLDQMRAVAEEKTSEFYQLQAEGFENWAKRLYGENVALNHKGVRDELQWQYNEALKNAKAAAEGSTKKANEQLEILNSARESYNSMIAVIENYESLDVALSVGDDIDAINEAASRLKYGFITANNATAGELIKQRDEFKEHYKLLKKDLEEGMPGVTEQAVEEAKNLVDKANEEIAKASPEFKESGMISMKGYIQGLKSAEGETKATALSLSTATVNGLSSESGGAGSGAYRAGWNTGANFSNGLSDGLEHAKAVASGIGGAISGMLAQTLAGAAMPNVFGLIPRHAKGTDFFRGGLTWINEEGGELINLPTGSQIIPHDISLRYAEEAARSASVVNNSFGSININIESADLSDGQSIRDTAAALSENVIAEIARRIDSQKRRSSAGIGR